MAEDNYDRDFVLAVNLSQVTAADGGGRLPDGPYVGKIEDMYIREENKGRIVVRVAVAEGPFAGATKVTGLNIPTDAKGAQAAYFRAFAESCGFTEAQLGKGEVKMKRSTFLGKNCYFDYANAEEQGAFDSVKFLRKHTYEVALARVEAGGGAAVNVKPATRPAAAPAASRPTKQSVAANFDDGDDEQAAPRTRRKAEPVADIDDIL